MKIERDMNETQDQALLADAAATNCAIELLDHWISVHARTSQYLATLECPMPGSSEYEQLAIALADGGHSFTPARLDAFNEAWGRRFYERQPPAQAVEPMDQWDY